MGALDDSHFAWLHPGILGDPAHPEAPEHDARIEGDYLISNHARWAPGHAGGELVRVTREAYATPTSLRLVIHRPTGTDIVYEAVSPATFDTAVPFIITARDYDTDPSHDEEHLEHEALIQSQDRPVSESQKPWLLPPLSARMQLYVRPDDVPLVALQKWLEKLGIPQI
jgi:vanillate O-demethylase monooxygenase subunit